MSAVSLAGFEQAVRDALSKREVPEMIPQEFTALLANHMDCNLLTEENRQLYERLKFWMSQPDLAHTKIICANLELVRFRSLGPQNETQFADPRDVKAILVAADVQSISIEQRAEPVEAFASQVDEYIGLLESGGSAALLIAPPAEEIYEKTWFDGESASFEEMFYISVRDLMKIVARSQSTATLNVFGMYYSMAIHTYLRVSSEMKANLAQW